MYKYKITPSQDFSELLNKIHKRMHYSKDSIENYLYNMEKGELLEKYNIDEDNMVNKPIGFIAENYNLQMKKIEAIKQKYSKKENMEFINLISLCIPIFEKSILQKKEFVKNKGKKSMNDYEKDIEFLQTMINDMYILSSAYNQL